MLKKLTSAALSTAICITAVFTGYCPASSHKQSADAALTEFDRIIFSDHRYSADAPSNTTTTAKTNIITTTTAIKSATTSAAPKSTTSSAKKTTVTTSKALTSQTSKTTTTTKTNVSKTTTAIKSATTSSAPKSTTSSAKKTTTTTSKVLTSTTSMTTTATLKEVLESGKLGENISYTLYSDGTLNIIGCGNMNNYTKCPFKSPKNIKNVVIKNDTQKKDNVLSDIGEYVFSGCTALKTITMTDTVTSIKSHAFDGCSSLDNIITSGKTTAKAGTLSIPDTVTEIGEYAFSGCTSLKSAVISGSKTDIGKYIFNKCTSLEELTLPFAGLNAKDVESGSEDSYIGNYFRDAVQGKTYPSNNFYDDIRNIPCSLKKITVTGGKNIPAKAFYDLSGVESIILPDIIISLGDRSFTNCKALTSFTIPPKTTHIGANAFKGCESIKKITIPDSVTNIGIAAFSGCSSITDITVPESVLTIGSRAFSDCSSLKKATFNGGKNGIGNYVLSGCIALEKLTLPFAGFSSDDANTENTSAQLINYFYDPVKNVTYQAEGSNGEIRYIPCALKEIIIIGGKNIPNNTFYSMSGIENITLPKEVANIGKNAFKGCDSLISVLYQGSAEEWQNVKVDSKNSILSEKIKFAYTSPTTTTTSKTTTTTSKATTTTTSKPATTTSKATTTTTSKPTTTTSKVTTTTTSKPTTTTSKVTTTTTSKTTTTTTKATTTAVITTVTQPADYSPGDVNNDGYVDSTDASLILAYYAKISTNIKASLTNAQIKAADINSDGYVNSVDASIILQYYAYASTTKDEVLSVTEYLAKKNK